VITSFELYLLTLLLSVPLYWFIGGHSRHGQTALLVAVSVLLQFMLSPLILVGSAAAGAFIAMLWLANMRGVGADTLKPLSWLVFLLLLLPEVVPGKVLASSMLGERAAAVDAIANWAYLGLSFTVIRSFIILRESVSENRLHWAAALSSLTFFGTFLAGPIVGRTPFKLDERAKRLEHASLIQALARLGWGLALLLVVAPRLNGWDLREAEAYAGRAAITWLDIYRSFIALYADFSGYSSIAIATGLLFGIQIPENFRMPLLARSVQEFWQRWHLTLGDFISRYLFKPLVRNTGKPTLAIFVAFVLVGLWHRISWTYLLWGIGHGAALALHMARQRRSKGLDVAPVHWSRQVLAWFVTISYIAILSKIANVDSLGKAGGLLMRLVGMA
jgi:alginate O-acetyltransferase complex protein AlgI